MPRTIPFSRVGRRLGLLLAVVGMLGLAACGSADDARHAILEVAEAAFEGDDLPDPSDTADRPELDLALASDTVLNGGGVFLPLTFNDPDGLGDVSEVIVAVDGHEGHLVADVESSDGSYELVVLLDEETPLGDLAMRIAARDRDGNVSEHLVRVFEVIQSGGGDVKVSLFFDRDVDIDLHVVEPDGEEVYYGNPVSADGAELDVDSNAGCDIDGINNENVFWPDAEAPEGEYIVRVDYYEACEQGPVNYLVTVRSGDQVTSYTGQFDAGDADAGGEGSGVEITRFSFPP